MSSSLNIVLDLTYYRAFQDTLGFKRGDVDELLKLQFPAMHPDERANHLAWIQSTWNGYCRSSFHVDGLYNPQGVWHCLQQLQNWDNRDMTRVDPTFVPPERDEMAAFLVKHAAGMLLPLTVLDSAVLLTTNGRFGCCL